MKKILGKIKQKVVSVIFCCNLTLYIKLELFKILKSNYLISFITSGTYFIKSEDVEQNSVFSLAHFSPD